MNVVHCSHSRNSTSVRSTIRKVDIDIVQFVDVSFRVGVSDHESVHDWCVLDVQVLDSDTLSGRINVHPSSDELGSCIESFHVSVEIAQYNLEVVDISIVEAVLEKRIAIC